MLTVNVVNITNMTSSSSAQAEKGSVNFIYIYRKKSVLLLRRLFIELFLASSVSLHLHAQGTINVDFEDFAVGTLPAYVRGGQFGVAPRIGDQNSEFQGKVPPYEGSKFLAAGGTAILSSPTAEPIKEFSLAVYVQAPPAGYRNTFIVAGEVRKIEQFDTWQSMQGSFDSPVASIAITSQNDLGEVFPAAYAIDGVRFATIPEPTVTPLLGIASIAFVMRKYI